MARLRLSQWDSAVADGVACLALAPDSMKAHYSLSQAHLALKAHDDALRHALRAHALCVAGGAAEHKSLGPITTHVLRCKKERWEERERRRVRGLSGLEAEVLGLLEKGREEAVREAEREVGGDDGAGGLGEEERREIEAEWEAKMEAMRGVFEAARPKEERRREVPDWAVDDISFCVMVDPVIVSILPCFKGVLLSPVGSGY